MQNYFRKNISKNNFGKFIQKELEGKIFDDKEIYYLFKMSNNYLDIISPSYYSPPTVKIKWQVTEPEQSRWDDKPFKINALNINLGKYDEEKKTRI